MKRVSAKNRKGNNLMFFERIELPKPRTLLTLGVGTMLCLSVAGAARAAQALKSAEAQLHTAWRASISSTALPGSGCFTAAYPDTAWTQVGCIAAPDRIYAPAHGPVAGGGNDYWAAVGSSVSSAVGSFPSITGLKSEKNIGVSDQYSLQLNTQYFTTAACSGSQYPPYCDGWQQFVFAQGGGKKGTSSAFMVYWVINYGPVCPTGWNQEALNCWVASSAVSVPHQMLSALADLQLSGTVASGGNDTVQLTTSSKAYAESASDSVLGLAGSWTDTEYNVLGDGGGSQANFNSGTTINVNIQLTDGAKTAPSCRSGAIFTNETNNLNLGTCTGQAGKNPSIAFAESD
jgi:hypothetical protein